MSHPPLHIDCVSSHDIIGTSKAYTPTSLAEVNTFGFRGEGAYLRSCETIAAIITVHVALASVANLCCLEISSRTQRSRECWSIISKVCNKPDLVYNGSII